MCTAYGNSDALLDKFYVIYLVITKKTAQKWHLWQELLKSTSKITKPSYGWMTWRRSQFEDISYIVMEDFINSGKRLTWAYKLKALKPT